VKIPILVIHPGIRVCVSRVIDFNYIWIVTVPKKQLLVLVTVVVLSLMLTTRCNFFWSFLGENSSPPFPVGNDSWLKHNPNTLHGNKPPSQPFDPKNAQGIPSRESTYPTLGKGKSSSKCHFWVIC